MLSRKGAPSPDARVMGCEPCPARGAAFPRAAGSRHRLSSNPAHSLRTETMDTMLSSPRSSSREQTRLRWPTMHYHPESVVSFGTVHRQSSRGLHAAMISGTLHLQNECRSDSATTSAVNLSFKGFVLGTLPAWFSFSHSSNSCVHWFRSASTTLCYSQPVRPANSAATLCITSIFIYTHVHTHIYAHTVWNCLAERP